MRAQTRPSPEPEGSIIVSIYRLFGLGIGCAAGRLTVKHRLAQGSDERTPRRQSETVRHASVSSDGAATMERCDVRKFVMVAAIALVMAAAMNAQSALTGVWEGASPGGERVTFDAKVTDTTLTGTVTINGDGKTIADGTFVNNAVSFTITLLNGTTQAFGGELVGEELRPWAARRGPANAAILQRVER
jgi:hypothetical protein